MRLRMALVAVATMVLTSCWWAGPVLYKGDPADAGPLKPGIYQLWALDTSDAKAREKSSHVRIAWLPDGSNRWVQTAAGEPDDISEPVMARLAIPGRDLWIAQTPIKKDATVNLYTLVEMRGGLMWVLPVIGCDATADIVRAAGGEVSGGSDPAGNEMLDPVAGNVTDGPARQNQDCTFPTRASLDAAIRAFLATNPRFTHRVRFKRIGD